MVTTYDVLADALIEEAVERLEDRIEQPDWMTFAKGGQTYELPPQRDDFWYAHSASLLRKVAMNGPVGVDCFSTEYGSLRRGPSRYSVSDARSGAGSKGIIRTLLQ